MEERIKYTYYSNDTPDPGLNDLYFRGVTLYHAIHEDNLPTGATTVATVEAEAPPANHEWVEMVIDTAPAGYTEDGAVTPAIYDAWEGTA